MAAQDYVAVVQQLYVSYFGRPADYYGLQSFEAQLDALKAPTTFAALNALVQSDKANTTALSKLVNSFNASAESASLYGTDNSTIGLSKFVAAIYTNVLGRDADVAGLNFWVGEIAAGRLTRANAAMAITDGALANTTAQGLLDAKTVQNKLGVATNFTAGLDTVPEINGFAGDKAAAAARDMLAQVKDTTVVASFQATVDATIASIVSGSIAGQTFTLTTGVDTVLGGSGADTINGNPGTANAATFTALDSIDGGAGIDTLNVTEIGATGAGAYTLNAAGTVKNVEILNYTVASDNVGDAVTVDVSTWTGLTTANVVISGTDAPVTALTTKGNVTAVSVNGATSAAITDSAAAGSQKLATVTLVDTSGLATITSDAVTALNLSGATGGATVIAAAGTRALAVKLDNVTAGTVTDATATGLTITTSGTKSSGVTVAAAAAKAVTIAADEALTLAGLTVAAATTLTVTGDSKVTVSAATLTALTSIDASAQTAGGIDTKAFALGTGVAFKGGAGADSIQIGASTKAITMGDGNDRVLLAAAALGTGGTVDAGAGNDTLAFSTADFANAAAGTTTFADSISGFETIELAGAGTAAVALNLANLDSASNVKLSADVTQALAISNMASGGTLSVTVSQTGATSVGVTNALTGTADVVNVSVAGAAAVNTGALTIADVETINYLTDDTATTPTGIAHVSNLSAAAVKTITVAGDAGLTLTNTNTTVTSFDASGVTKGAVTWTTGALAAAATIKGGVGANTINFSAATKAVTYTGGAGVDTVTGNGSNNTISTAAGNDIVTLGNGANTVDLGAGDDTITVGTGLNVVTLGAGNDNVTLVVNTNGNTYTTVTDAAVGDILTFVNQGVETFNATKLALADTAVFQDYLDAATAGNGAVNGAISWFQFGGNTYVVEDLGAGATFTNGTDLVVKLTGAVDLSTATGAGTNVITLA